MQDVQNGMFDIILCRIVFVIGNRFGVMTGSFFLMP